jgi:transposase
VDDQRPPRYNRDKLRYPSDLTDAEWAYVEPLIPPARRGGGKRRVDMRDVVNGVMYVLSTGCQWRYIPKDLLCSPVLNQINIASGNPSLSRRHEDLV